MIQPLTALTKAVAVALDIAGRPDTEDAYALNSVRKAYSLLNGGTFQDLAAGYDSASQPSTYGIDWQEAYRLEVAKSEALARQVSNLLELNTKPCPSAPQPWDEHPREAETDHEPSQRIERTRAQILAAMMSGAQTVTRVSQVTSIHPRTVQRRLRELIEDRMVEQSTPGVTPVYTVASNKP
jgi:Mn-dependent DtxR family transcriptional regulator